jgi:glycosyltransferase involved in cell wall biosynthesis
VAETLGPVAINATALLTPLTGIGRYTRELALQLPALLGEAPWLFYAREWSREVRDAPAPSRHDAATRLKGNIPFAYEMARVLQQRHFRRGVREHRIALYHEPNYLAFRFDGPTVVTVHDLSWIRHPDTHPAERVRAMERALPGVVAHAAHVLTDSEFVRAEIVGHFGIPADRVSAVPLGVDADFAPVARERCEPVLRGLGLEYGGYVLALGTLEPRKNVGSAMDAHAALPEALRERFPLAVAGMRGWGPDGTTPAREAAVARGDMRLLGYVPHEVLAPLYSGARCLVYPSLYEGFGLPPLEAMACGTPVIASRRASLPEVVGEAGVLVEPEAGEIRDVLRRLLEDDALHARLAGAGRAHSRHFTWRRCAEGTAAAYRRGASFRAAPIGP